MSYTYDDYCAAQEGPEPDSMPCPDCNTPDHADPSERACPTCGGTGEVNLRAERERVRCEQARRYAEHNAAHWRGVYDLLGIDPDADTEAA